MQEPHRVGMWMMNLKGTDGIAVMGLLATASAATIRIPATELLNADMGRSATIKTARTCTPRGAINNSNTWSLHRVVQLHRPLQLHKPIQRPA